VPRNKQLFKSHFHIILRSLSKNFFLSADSLKYFCLTCTQTEQFQTLAPAANRPNVSGNTPRMTIDKKTDLKINQRTGSIPSSLLVLLLLILSVSTLVFAIMRIINNNDFYSYLLIFLFCALTIATIYCAAYLIRTIYITDTRFILHRPYAKFWIRKLKTDLINVALADISTIYIDKDGLQKGDGFVGSWKIVLKNKSSVAFPYEAARDDLVVGTNKLMNKGITIKLIK
jgi:hypothetical protein